MRPQFAAVRGGGVSVSLDQVETALVRQLAEELLLLLGEDDAPTDMDPLAAAVGIGTATTAPEDPVLARLLPDAYPGDPEAAADFRRYTETGLRERKRAAARTVLDTLAGLDALPARRRKVRLDPEQAQAWLGALNDLRLALGTRLGVTEEVHELIESLDEDDPAYTAYAIYDYLTWLQEMLVRALKPSS